jgi:LacI family transcriptional regulator
VRSSNRRRPFPEADLEVSTIKDVAREAGVSAATVSRVFNQSAVVSETARRRVRAVAQRLNYWPNGVARSLITNRTHALGVLLPELYGELFTEILRGVDLAARNEGFHVLVSSSHSHTDELIAALRSMRGRIDGAIVMAPDVDARTAIRKSAVNLPLVLIDPEEGNEGFDTISIANYDGAYAMVRHLLNVGHRRIATVTGPQRNVDARQRLDGYRAALADAGVAFAPELEIPGDFTEPSGYEAVARLLRLEPRPSAVFAANDYMAVGALGALSDAGMRVPEDVAVTGFDDIALARYLNPPLTTVHVDALSLGERAARRVLGLRSAPAPVRRQHEVLRTLLVVRASCGSGGSSRAKMRRGLTRGR